MEKVFNRKMELISNYTRESEYTNFHADAAGACALIEKKSENVIIVIEEEFSFLSARVKKAQNLSKEFTEIFALNQAAHCSGNIFHKRLPSASFLARFISFSIRSKGGGGVGILCVHSFMEFFSFMNNNLIKKCFKWFPGNLNCDALNGYMRKFSSKIISAFSDIFSV